MFYLGKELAEEEYKACQKGFQGYHPHFYIQDKHIKYLSLAAPDGRYSFEFLENYAAFSELEELVITGGRSAKFSEDIIQLPKLHSISVLQKIGTKDLKNICGLPQLDYLQLTNNSKLPNELFNLSNLETLILGRADQLANLSPITKLTSLRYLDLHGLSANSQLKELNALTNLECLKIYSYSQLQIPEPDQWANLTKLTSLSLFGRMDTIPPVIMALGSLKDFHMQPSYLKDPKEREVYTKYGKSGNITELFSYLGPKDLKWHGNAIEPEDML